MVREHFLGLNNLPDVAGKLSIGRIYAVMHDVGQGLEIVCATLVAACTSSRAVWVAEIPSAYLGIVPELGGEVAECLRAGKLRIFQVKTESYQGNFLNLLDELDFIGVERGSLIIVEGVDQFIEPANPHVWTDEVTTWQRWAEHTGCAVLWMCAMRIGQSNCESELLRMAHRFSGLARLRKLGSEVRWEAHYWFAQGGLLVDKSFLLATDVDGSWRVDEHDTHRSDVAAAHMVDEDEVFIIQAALPSLRSSPGGWRLFETVEQMKKALSSAHAPTVVFHYHAGVTSLESIVRSVFDLRNSIGAYVKIAVKESGGQLRHSHEQLLLSMGANLTIPSETGLARMLSLLKSMQGQVYSHVLPHSFDEAMASVMDVTQMGYLTQANFIAAVSDLVERTQSLQVHNALVRLSLTPGLGVLETLRCCVMKRPGDLYTANTENVFVFLFACEEQDVGTTLDRLFRLPISVLFSTESRFLSAADIVNALEDFKLQSTGVVVSEDYTVALKNNAFLEPELPNNPVPTASVQTEIRPAFKAVPHALKLRHVTV